MASESKPPSDQPVARNQSESLWTTRIFPTSQQDGTAYARLLEQVNVVPRHLVHAAFPWLGREEVRVMDGPDIAVQAPQEEVAESRAAAVVFYNMWF